MVVWDARSVFPNVDFFGTKIHSSDSFTELQKQNLTIINNIIGSHFNYLPCITPHQFHTMMDEIQWTEETAKRIFKYWCKSLQLDAGLE